MKVKGVIEDLKIKKMLKKEKRKKKERMMIKIVKIYLGLSLVLWAVWDSSFLDSSLVRLIFLKIYRPLPM